MFVVVVVGVSNRRVQSAHFVHARAVHPRNVCDTHARISARVETEFSSNGI